MNPGILTVESGVYPFAQIVLRMSMLEARQPMFEYSGRFGSFLENSRS